MSDTIGVSDLLPADVLLYKGTSFISRGIQFFDGTDFSHASLYLGDGKVGEAIASGLERSDIHKSVHGAEWVKVYRLKNRPPDVSVVLDKAKEYLDDGPRYGYEQILLLAFLSLTRKLKVTPSLAVFIRRVLDAAATTLTRLQSQNREPMICSEFVYRAYDEAVPEIDDPFSLRINEWLRAMLRGMSGMAMPGGVPVSIPRGQGVHPESLLAFLTAESSSVWLRGVAEPTLLAAPTPEAVDESEIEALAASYLGEARPEAAPDLQKAAASPEKATMGDLLVATEGLASNLFSATHDEPALMAGMGGIAINKSPMIEHLFQVAADFVTPGDLFKTQSLFFVGQLEI